MQTLDRAGRYLEGEDEGDEEAGGLRAAELIELKPTRTGLYRHFDEEGRLLYVGVSLSVPSRLAQHKKHSRWFCYVAKMVVEYFPSRESALDAERKAIETERPLFNKTHNYSRGSYNPAVEQSLNEISTRLVLFDPVYTYEQAGRVLGVNRDAIKKLVANGDLGSINIGNVSGRERISGWQLLDYLESLHKKPLR